MSKYQVMRPLNPVERDKLKASIEQYGVQQPIVLDETGEILDGHHRREIAEELSVECPHVLKFGLTEEEKIELSYQLNLTGRSLTKEEREQAWADMRARGMSYRQIAEADGTVSPQTVMRSTVPDGTVAQPETVTGKDGKKRQARTSTNGPESATRKPRFSTVNIYRDVGLIPEAKSGAATQKLNAEIEGIAPGAIKAKDAARVNAAALTIKARREGERALEEPTQEAAAARIKLNQKEESKLDIAIRKARRALEIEYEVMIEKRVTAWLDEVLPKYNLEFEFYKKSNDSYKGVMSREQYKDLEGFLHPDRHPGNEARAARLFSLVRDNKFLLCGDRPEELMTGPGSLPKTAAELMANRRKRH